MDSENNKWWDKKKEELLENIRQTKELGTTDVEILNVMEEILKTAKIRKSITDFYKDISN